jgi:hypothetical protein
MGQEQTHAPRQMRRPKRKDRLAAVFPKPNTYLIRSAPRHGETKEIGDLMRQFVRPFDRSQRANPNSAMLARFASAPECSPSVRSLTVCFPSVRSLTEVRIFRLRFNTFEKDYDWLFWLIGSSLDWLAVNDRLRRDGRCTFGRSLDWLAVNDRLRRDGRCTFGRSFDRLSIHRLWSWRGRFDWLAGYYGRRHWMRRSLGRIRSRGRSLSGAVAFALAGIATSTGITAKVCKHVIAVFVPATGALISRAH